MKKTMIVLASILHVVFAGCNYQKGQNSASTDISGDKDVNGSGTTTGAKGSTESADTTGSGETAGSDGTTGPDTTPPTVVSTSPADQTPNADVNAPITVTFSEPMAPASMTTATFSVGINNQKVKGTVSYSGVTATFTPSEKLPLMAPLAVSLTGDMTDVAGNHLSQTAFGFTTREGVWGTPKPVENNANNEHAVSPDIAVGPRGEVFVTWLQGSDNQMYNVFANVQTDSADWSATPPLLESNSGQPSFVTVAADAKGNAFAIWSQADATTENIWISRYQADTGQWALSPLEQEAGIARDPQVVTNRSGEAFAIWWQAGANGVYQVLSKKYVSASNQWSPTPGVVSKGPGNASSVSITSDSKGYAMAVFKQEEGPTVNLWANRYDAAAGWDKTKAVMIESKAGNILDQKVAMDAVGNAIAVWAQETDTNGDGKVDTNDKFSVFANRYFASTGVWGQPSLLDSDNSGDAEIPEVAFTSDGDALAVWQQSVGGVISIYSSRYNASLNQWSAAAPLETNDGEAKDASIAVDKLENAMAVWSQTVGGKSRIYAARYTAAGWGTPMLVEHDETVTAKIPHVGIDRQGRTVVVWTQSDGTNFHVWSNRFE